MKLMKATPSLATVRNDFDRVFDRFFATPLWPLTTPRMATDTMWEPSLDFSENPKEYVVRLEVPGITRDDLDVNLDGNLLTLSGKREFHKQERARTSSGRSGRRAGSCERSDSQPRFRTGRSTPTTAMAS